MSFHASYIPDIQYNGNIKTGLHFAFTKILTKIKLHV